MSQQYQAPPKNEMDHPRLALRGVKHQQGKQPPNLKVALLANLVRLRCYTGIEGEKTISVKLDPRELEAIAYCILNKVIPNKEDHKLKMEQKSLYVGGQKRDTPGVVATIIVGRHKGQAFITIFGYNTPKVIFPFTYGDTMAFYEDSGDQFNPIDESNIAAYSWCKTVLGMAYPATVKNYKHPESNFDKKGGGNGGGNNSWGNKGGNGGGNNSWGGNNGGGNSSADNFDDDIAF